MQNYTPYSPATIISLVFVGMLATGALVSACDSGRGNDGDGGQSALIPLNTGNSWTYEVQDNSRGEDNGSTEQATLEITRSLTIDEEQHYEMDPGIDQYETDGEPFLARPREEGLYVTEENLVGFPLRYPAEDGKIYTHTDDDGNEYKITVTDQTITVPAGTFDCLQYEIEFDGSGAESGLGFSGSACISPDVGPIQIDLGIFLEANLASHSLE